MPKPTPQEKQQHKAFLKRQQINEQYYSKFFYAYLKLVYSQAANVIKAKGMDFYLQNELNYLHIGKLKNIYIRLYKKVTIDEAINEKGILPQPKFSTKDIIDDFASMVPFTTGEDLKLWKKLLKEYIESRIAVRISQVTETTIKYVTKIILEGINNGDGAVVVAKRLEEEGDFNKNRALVIARTETVTAMNQGKYIAALSSKFEMEKRWIPTNDKRTRSSHYHFLNSSFIEMEALFKVDKKDGNFDVARYPGDESLSAENTVNCRCSISFKLKRNSTGNVIRKL